MFSLRCPWLRPWRKQWGTPESCLSWPHFNVLLNCLLFIFISLHTLLIAISIKEIIFLVVAINRKWSSYATRELRRSVVELSSLWHWPVMDMFTHLDKVHFHIKVTVLVLYCSLWNCKLFDGQLFLLFCFLLFIFQSVSLAFQTPCWRINPAPKWCQHWRGCS